MTLLRWNVHHRKSHAPPPGYVSLSGPVSARYAGRGQPEHARSSSWSPPNLGVILLFPSGCRLSFRRFGTDLYRLRHGPAGPPRKKFHRAGIFERRQTLNQLSRRPRRACDVIEELGRCEDFYLDPLRHRARTATQLRNANCAGPRPIRPRTRWSLRE